jgi:hypothetical protein
MYILMKKTLWAIFLFGTMAVFSNCWKSWEKVNASQQAAMELLKKEWYTIVTEKKAISTADIVVDGILDDPALITAWSTYKVIWSNDTIFANISTRKLKITKTDSKKRKRDGDSWENEEEFIVVDLEQHTWEKKTLQDRGSDILWWEFWEAFDPDAKNVTMKHLGTLIEKKSWTNNQTVVWEKAWESITQPWASTDKPWNPIDLDKREKKGREKSKVMTVAASESLMNALNWLKTSFWWWTSKERKKRSD